jgi:hypothetical protein
MSDTASVTWNNKDFELYAGFTLTMTGNSSLNGNILSFGAGTALDLVGGTITLSNANSIQSLGGATFSSFTFDWTGAVGEASVVQTNNTNADKTLATKVAKALFLIDGVRIDPTADGTDIAALNAELYTLGVNGKTFQVTENAGVQTVDLVVVPEPGTMVLLGLGSLVCLRKRK